MTSLGIFWHNSSHVISCRFCSYRLGPQVKRWAKASRRPPKTTTPLWTNPCRSGSPRRWQLPATHLLIQFTRPSPPPLSSEHWCIPLSPCSVVRRSAFSWNNSSKLLNRIYPVLNKTFMNCHFDGFHCRRAQLSEVLVCWVDSWTEVWWMPAFLLWWPVTVRLITAVLSDRCGILLSDWCG